MRNLPSLAYLYPIVCLVKCFGSFNSTIPTKIIGFNTEDHCEHVLFTNNASKLNNLIVGFNRVPIINLGLDILRENTISNSSELETLTLDDNGITEIYPGAFGNLPVIKRISFANNKLKTVRSGIFNHLDLLMLMLSSNEIETIESNAFDNMTQLISIVLSYNKIKTIDPDWFRNCDSLLTISLDGNEITQIPENAFKNINCIHTLNNNTIRSNIYMGRNKIKRIHPRAFGNITEIGYIWLQENFLTELENDLFSGFNFISTLRLNKNNLTCLSDEILSDLKCAKFVNIDDNPWEPACLNRIQSWADKNDIRL
ncbi:BspA type Leucine rich repeat region (6 copies) [Popillia japonica]|uniref:BspA type Leucine rich repeat region (6 copies) n=1 Tax=Popillia japonica TaxID=7064 RepID=A0AAW1ITE5_POPJA